MVQEMINQVKDAEKEASNVVVEAEKNSVYLISEAKRQAVEIKAKSEMAARKKGDALFDAKRSEFEDQEGRISQETQKEIKSIENIMEKNKEETIEKVIKNFY